MDDSCRDGDCRAKHGYRDRDDDGDTLRDDLETLLALARGAADPELARAYIAAGLNAAGAALARMGA